jgi:8-oxo-dGTP diphosphatase
MNNLTKREVTENPAEKEWWENYDPAKYQSPRLAVYFFILTVKEGALHAVLVKRNHYPEKGLWALPGVFVRIDESLDQAARRALNDKAGIKGVFLEQLYTFGSVDRDPRARVVSVTYYALVDHARLAKSLKNTDVHLTKLDVPWSGEKGGPVYALDKKDNRLDLAFDHSEILGVCVKRLRGKISYVPIGFELLPKKFTLRDLQKIHQAILNKSLNKDSFRRKVLQSGLIRATGKSETSTAWRPAELYQFKGAKNGRN